MSLNDITLKNMETALRMEIDAIKHSVKFCREVLGIQKLSSD